MKKINIYFAHTLSEREEVAAKVIPVAAKYFNVINPFATRLKAFKGLTVEEIKGEATNVMPNWVVGHDYRLLDISEAIIVYNPNGPTYGTAFEAAYMFERNKPIIFIINESFLGHPWLYKYGTAVTTDLEEGCKILAGYFDMETFIIKEE